MKREHGEDERAEASSVEDVSGEEMLKTRLDDALRELDALRSQLTQSDMTARRERTQAQIRLQAMASGALDPDDIAKFLDIADEVLTPEACSSLVLGKIEALRESKPYLFASASGVRHVVSGAAPRPFEGGDGDVRRVSNKEYESRKKIFLRS